MAKIKHFMSSFSFCCFLGNFVAFNLLWILGLGFQASLRLNKTHGRQTLVSRGVEQWWTVPSSLRCWGLQRHHDWVPGRRRRRLPCHLGEQDSSTPGTSGHGHTEGVSEEGVSYTVTSGGPDQVSQHQNPLISLKQQQLTPADYQHLCDSSYFNIVVGLYFLCRN